MNNIDFQARIFKALGHPLRLKILKKLVSGELCVCKLVDDTEFTQANLSQHLKILSNAGLIVKRKERNYSHYRISDDKTLNLLKNCEDLATNYKKKLL
ncbi:metalloregulator ArsR/SmtB family transcription factor [Psychrilyobacter sp.]|uniref:ArsR/SmtB family transcription factor n=1 Tax=Psychrilyobacter sp. TaxID=2586924 RepID=UPI0030167A02